MSSNRTISRRIELAGVDKRLLFGHQDVFLKLIERELGLKITARSDWALLEGPEKEVEWGAQLFEDLSKRVQTDDGISERYILYAIAVIKSEGAGPSSFMGEEGVVTSVATREQIKPRTIGQETYVKAIDKSDVVFAIGPAGTGKTYLAVAKAVSAFKEKQVQRIILTRPAVEAGESLGFLPGDLRAKVDPYLRPLYDALHDMLAAEKIKKLLELGIIEIAPLAFMRGRTLNNSFVILDEAQNTTQGQMKMFLTRLGVGSKAVITGDVTQIDLERPAASGLLQAEKILSPVKGLAFIYLTERDVVRHRLVQDIIKAYDKHERSARKRRRK